MNAAKKELLNLIGFVGLSIFVVIGVHYFLDNLFLTTIFAFVHFSLIMIYFEIIYMPAKANRNDIEEYNERLKWQKERTQMSFEERLHNL